MKILILKPSSLGDVVLALPVLRQLKKKFPSNSIYWWLSDELQPLLASDPDLDGLFLWRRKRWSRPQFWPEILASVRQVREHRFDYVIDLQGLARSSIFGWMAGGAHFIGLNDAREGARALYQTTLGRDPAAGEIHAADWYQTVLPYFGIEPSPHFTWLPEFPEARAAISARWNTSPGPWVLLNPGARWENKRWPAQYFAELVHALVRAGYPGRFAILGGREDAELAETIVAADRERCVNLAAQTTLPELVEWIRLGALMVSNDTGPIHIAAALGIPIVGLYGPTAPWWTGPYRQTKSVLGESVPCAPCNRSHCSYTHPLQCLKGVSPAQVAEKVLLRLSLDCKSFTDTLPKC